MQFPLLPFSESEGITRLDAAFTWHEDHVTLRYALDHDPHTVRIAPERGQRKRETGLWETTCFEFFLAQPHAAAYLEYNQSPSGNWNCFSFTGLRSGMQESDALVLSSFSRQQHDTELVLELVIDHQLDWQPPLRLGLSAVIELEHTKAYFALGHGKAPDFHDPSFHKEYR